MTLLSSQLIPSGSGIKDKDTSEYVQRKLNPFLEQLIIAIASIPFNRSEALAVSDTGVADTEFSVAHHLMRVPEGFIVTSIDKAGIVYKSATAWTTSAVYLKCSAANASIKLCVF